VAAPEDGKQKTEFRIQEFQRAMLWRRFLASTRVRSPIEIVKGVTGFLNPSSFKDQTPASGRNVIDDE
jgi:hypothetical protein